MKIGRKDVNDLQAEEIQASIDFINFKQRSLAKKRKLEMLNLKMTSNLLAKNCQGGCFFMLS